MKSYEEDVLSISAGKAIELVEKYGVYKCPNTEDYNYTSKAVLFWAFREDEHGAMSRLYQLKAICLLPHHIDEDELRVLDIPEEDKKAIGGYQKEEKEKVERGEVEWPKEHDGVCRFYIFDGARVVLLPSVALPKNPPQGLVYYRLCDILNPEVCNKKLIPTFQCDYKTVSSYILNPEEYNKKPISQVDNEASISDSAGPNPEPLTIKKLVQVLGGVLQKFYGIWDKKKGRVPKKCVSFFDPKLAKFRAMSEKKQVAVAFGSLGVVLLFCVVAFSGGSGYEDILERQEENQERLLAMEKEAVKEKLEEMLRTLRKKKTALPNLATLRILKGECQNVDVDFSIEEVKDAFFTCQNGQEKIELAIFLFGGDFSEEVKEFLGVTDEWVRTNACRYLEEGSAELPLEKRDFKISKDLLEILPEKTLCMIAELGNSQAFDAYLEKQKKISVDKGVEWLVSIAGKADVAGNVYSAISRLTKDKEVSSSKAAECLMKIVMLPDFKEKVLPDIINLYWDVPVACDYINKNFGTPAVAEAIKKAGVDGETILFANKVKNNEDIDLLESAKNLLVGMSCNAMTRIYLGETKDPEKEIVFKGSSARPTRGHRLLMKYLIEAEKNGNQDATKILDAYLSKVGKKYLEDFPFFELREFKKALADDLASNRIVYLMLFASRTGKGAPTEEEYYNSKDLPAMSQACVEYFLEKAPEIEKKFSFDSILDLKLKLTTNKSIDKISHDKLMRDLFQTILSNQERVWEMLEEAVTPTGRAKSIVSVTSENLSLAKEIGGDSSFVNYVELLGLLDAKSNVKAKSLVVSILNKTDDIYGLRALASLSKRQDFFSVVHSIKKQTGEGSLKNHVATEALEIIKVFCDLNLAKGKRKELAKKFWDLNEKQLPKNPIHNYFLALIHAETARTIVATAPHKAVAFALLKEKTAEIFKEYSRVIKAGLLNINSEYYNGDLQTASEAIYFKFALVPYESLLSAEDGLSSEREDTYSAFKRALDLVKNRKSYAPYLELGRLLAEETTHVKLAKSCLNIVVKKGTSAQKKSAQSILEKL